MDLSGSPMCKNAENAQYSVASMRFGDYSACPEDRGENARRLDGGRKCVEDCGFVPLLKFHGVNSLGFRPDLGSGLRAECSVARIWIFARAWMKG
jgi:hypothetical protein